MKKTEMIALLDVLEKKLKKIRREVKGVKGKEIPDLIATSSIAVEVQYLAQLVKETGNQILAAYKE